MNIENEIFQKSKIDLDKLISYGFIKQNENYIISKKICNEAFRVDIVVSELGVVKGKIFDLNFESEYTNYRLENQMGQFVSNIREEFKNILERNKVKVTLEKTIGTMHGYDVKDTKITEEQMQKRLSKIKE